MQRRGSRGNINPDEDEPIKPVREKEKDFTKEQVMSFVNILWFGLKIMLILFVVFPFIDKIRHKDYFSKAINLINDYDIGCKPCICANGLNRTMKNEEEKDKGSL